MGSRGRWWRQLIPPLLAGSLALSGSVPVVLAAPQASVDVNRTAFNPPCDNDANGIVPNMQTAAVAAYNRMNYTARGYTGAAFTRGATLARTPSDWGYYVHSHGDYYWHNADGRRWTGFREDSGDCNQAIVYSKDFSVRRVGRQSNLVFVSTCHAADSNTTMPGGFAIEKIKAVAPATRGPEFFVGYIGIQWDNDEWIFEQRFWNALADRRSVGAAFDIAMNGNFNHAGFDADWWGTYHWSGWGGPWTTCFTCS